MPRSRYRIFDGDDSPYFLTMTTVNWLPLFSNPDIARIVLDALSFLQSERQVTLFAYVLMENHLHWVAGAEGLAKKIGRFKSYTARCAIDYYEKNGNETVLRELSLGKLRHRTDRQFQFWQEGSHPKRIGDEKIMRQKIEYIHQNPVRRGYVDAPEHWCYSSARNYAGLPGILEVCMEW